MLRDSPVQACQVGRICAEIRPDVITLRIRSGLNFVNANDEESWATALRESVHVMREKLPQTSEPVTRQGSSTSHPLRVETLFPLDTY